MKSSSTVAQGDVIRMTDEYGQTPAHYQYDPYGNTIAASGSHKDINPLRYRSYVYDQETALYYLQSRYYNPEVGRWLNADIQLCNSLGVLGVDMFTYCLNNPVNKSDSSGNKPGDLFDTIDEAAKDAAIYIGLYSFESGHEYSATIYSVQITTVSFVTITKTCNFLWWSWSYEVKKKVTSYKTRYSYRNIITNEQPDDVNPETYRVKTAVAAVHTHPLGSGEGITKISSPDRLIAGHEEVLMYVYGPNGEMRRYDYRTGEDVLVFADLPVSPKKLWLD